MDPSEFQTLDPADLSQETPAADTGLSEGDRLRLRRLISLGGWTTDDMADVFDVAESTIRNWIRDGVLPPYRWNYRRRMWDPKEVIEWVKARNEHAT